MAQTALAFPTLESGSFFKTDNGRTWLLTDIRNGRWNAIPVDDLDRLQEVMNFIPPQRCSILDTDDVHAMLLEMLYERCLKTDPGSQEGALHGDDFSGACSKSPSIIVQRKTYRRRFIPKPPFTSFLLRLFGSDFVAKFFIGLETLSGFYKAKEETFSHPDDTWAFGALITRGMARSYEEFFGEPSGGSGPPMVTGTVPDLDTYQDQSQPATVLPHLRRIKDNNVLSRIANKAKLAAIRQAAAQILQERLRSKKRRR